MRSPLKEPFAMSGERFLLDTNAVISLLRGEAGLVDRLAVADWVGISIITLVEFLSFAGLNVAANHEVVPPAQERPLESEHAQPSHQLSTRDRREPAHTARRGSSMRVFPSEGIEAPREILKSNQSSSAAAR